MKKLFFTISLMSSSLAMALGPSVLFGGWELTKFLVNSPKGTGIPFCKGVTGKIIYERNGYMSVAINCPAHAAKNEPADKYKRMLFYAGSFAINDKNEVIHHITNSSSVGLIGKEATRKIETLDEKNLVLTGPFGSEGDTLRIEWTRLATAPVPAVIPATSNSKVFSMLTILKVKPEFIEAFKKEISKIVAPSLAESGKIDWNVQQSQTDSTEFVFYTRWKNKDALDFHLNSQSLKDYLKATSSMLVPGHLQLVPYWPVDLQTQ